MSQVPIETPSFEIPVKQIEGLMLYIDGAADSLYKSTDNAEPSYQIKEGCSYEYEFSDENYRLVCPNQGNVVTQRKRHAHTGSLAPNIYVGKLQLAYYHQHFPEKIHNFAIEVRSVKASYQKDYRYMLNDIAEHCTDLILQANSPVSQTVTINPNLDNQTLYQRFAFIKSSLESEEFITGLQKILTNPSTKWQAKQEQTDVRQIKKFNAQQTRQLISATNRQKLPQNHHLTRIGIQSIATKITANQKTETNDTNENRFIKYALESYLHFCEEIYTHPNAGEHLINEAKDICVWLENELQHSFFQSISRPQSLNLNSPLLQNKSGYREHLKTWLNYDLSSKLIWQGGDDVYDAGKKDIATLYEYWLFFKLIDTIAEVFKLDKQDLNNLITSSSDGLSLSLKQGKFIAIQGQYTSGTRDLNIVFHYNKSFKKTNAREKAGSWTTPMRPDYTLSIWPKALSQEEAEKQELIVHIHFDAKYKIANFKKLLENDNLDQEKQDNKQGIYKNADILKMHAYKDAIKRTGGAYVLYPGSEDNAIQGFHEILPGLGAFAIAPNKEKEETTALKKFIQGVLSHFLNRASQRENIANKVYEITSHQNNALSVRIPEYAQEKKLIADETFVLVGYCKSKKHLEWVSKHNVYNFRAGAGRGALKLNHETLNAKYLLLHLPGIDQSPYLYEITNTEYSFVEKEWLINKEYPSKPSQNSYLTVPVKLCNADEFINFEWAFKELTGYQTGHNSALPFVVSMREFLTIAKKITLPSDTL